MRVACEKLSLLIWEWIAIEKQAIWERTEGTVAADKGETNKQKNNWTLSGTDPAHVRTLKYKTATIKQIVIDIGVEKIVAFQG